MLRLTFLAVLAVLASVAESGRSDPVEVVLFDDVQGSILAASLSGEASCEPDSNSCIAVSGTGNATGRHAASGTGTATGTSTATSGIGNASAGIDGTNAGLAAVSATGRANVACESVCVAISGTNAASTSSCRMLVTWLGVPSCAAVMPCSFTVCWNIAEGACFFGLDFPIPIVGATLEQLGSLYLEGVYVGPWHVRPAHVWVTATGEVCAHAWIQG